MINNVTVADNDEIFNAIESAIAKMENNPKYTRFDFRTYVDKDVNCYKDYTPEKVMKIFKEVFID